MRFTLSLYVLYRIVLTVFVHVRRELEIQKDDLLVIFVTVLALLLAVTLLVTIPLVLLLLLAVGCKGQTQKTGQEHSNFASCKLMLHPRA